MYGGQHWFGGGFMWIFWIVLLVCCFWMAKAMASNDTKNTDKKLTQLDILNDRYAKGEINKNEYDQKKEDLKL